MSTRTITTLAVPMILSALACERPGQYVSAAAPTADRSALRTLLSAYPCASQTESLIVGWDASGAPERMAPSPAREERFRIPTSVIGEWIIVEGTPSRPPRLMRMRPGGTEAWALESDCETRHIETTTAPTLEAGVSRFTDLDLRALISENTRVVVYVWSPHMPLSVDGYPEIREAADALGLAVAPVLFAGADREFAAREARRIGIPEEGLRELAAIELTLRESHVHAPTVLVFDEDRVSPVLPGYRNAAGYTDFLKTFLEGR